ncbi:hypothetical protein LTS08_008608 [Lithohypha guttulata]|uniref:signal transducing kinase of the PAK n=1 Tax=Lithohypha guttulata TaxID=1690604 RepID=UPI002DE0E1D1|nr:hypothetical protein LTS08_008608 [Lithohypha guttulata]
MERDRSTHIYGDNGKQRLRQLLTSARRAESRMNEHDTSRAHQKIRAPEGERTPDQPEDRITSESPERAKDLQPRKRKLSTAIPGDSFAVRRSGSTKLAAVRSLTPHTPRTPRLATVWSQYCSGYEVNFGGGFLYVASQRHSPSVLTLIRQGQLKDEDERIAVLSKCRSEYVVQFMEWFDAGNEQFLVFESMDMSLLQVASAVRRPREDEIAAIARQIFHGLKAMAQHNIVHGRLRMFNILANLDGRVKICMTNRSEEGYPSLMCQGAVLDESCHFDPHNLGAQRQSVAAVGDIVLELAAVADAEEDVDDDTVALADDPNTDCTRLREFQIATQSDELDSLLQAGCQPRRPHRTRY